MTPVTDAYTWQGRDVLSADEEKIGKVKEIYEDQRTGKPEWALVTSGLFGTQSHFVPLAGAEPRGEAVRVRVSKDQVKESPTTSEGELSEEEERHLFEHYGVPYTEEGSVTAEGAPRPEAGDGDGSPLGDADDRSVGHDVSGPNTDDAMTRSEEELRVGKAQREAGRARLRKYVVTEQVQTTVPVQREEVRVEREPVTDANLDQALDGPEISEEEHEVVLHEEVPVVDKEVAPKERVSLQKDVQTEEREISEELRKERIETDGNSA
jgi:uncharacterized protein (TIGR02271 family)